MTRTRSRLFLLAFLTLFLELVLIRYLAGNVWNLGYFPNLVLIAVFNGIGVGFVFHDRVPPLWSQRLVAVAMVLLLGLVALLTLWRPVVPGFTRWEGDVGGELYFTAVSARTPSDSPALFGALFASAVLIFVCMSQSTAKLFKQLPPLRAYTLDIAGSCAGILSFMAMSWLQLPPAVWFLLIAPIAFFAIESRKARWIALVAVCAAAPLAQRQDRKLTSDPSFTGTFETHWSPYQKVEYVPEQLQINVNGIAHQTMYPLEALRASFYQVPYTNREKAGQKARNVLVIGAGSGNDVATALSNGVDHVDAIEIDPAIAQLGRTYHPARPYDDPRVTLVVDDARAFMTRTQRKYDLIVFALTDSLVKVSSVAQLRLENFLFTRESIARAYSLLSDSGELVFYNYYRRPWLFDKLEQAIHEATGRTPSTIYQRYDFMMRSVSGTSSTLATTPHEPVDVATDDWPFPYLRQRSMPSLYVEVLLGLSGLIGGVLLLLQLRRPHRASAGDGLPARVAFLLMGAAFLLLETKSIVQFSLLFGTTWVNTSLVFLAILTSVLAANWTAQFARGRWALPIVFALLIPASLLALVCPLAHLLQVESVAVRFLAASALTFAPIYFANLAFSITFRDETSPEHLFGWNMVGATLGALLEYMSMAVGYAALALVVAGCYAVVAVLLLSARARARLARD